MRNRRNRQRRPQELSGAAARPLSLTVTEIGAAGDGVAYHDGARYFVPLSLPGEIVTARPERRSSNGTYCVLISVDSASPQRIKPLCPVYGRCGGCSFQHWQGDALKSWKQTRVEDALHHRGFDDFDLEDVIDPVHVCAANTRRRATLAFKGKKLGFRPASGHGVIAIETCPVLLPELSRLIAPLRAVLVGVTEDASVRMTWTDAGADVAIESKDEPGWEQREALAGFATDYDIARLSWDNGFGAVPIRAERHPFMTFAECAVMFPEGGFLQPSPDGEAALRAQVLAHVPHGQKAVDLFCGLGTFSLPLTEISEEVLAVDSDGAAVAALAKAVTKRQDLQPRLKVETRDLFSDPLTAKELDAFDVVVFDPPRAGANAQAQELAKSMVGTVIAVSCNPASFARDARTLVNGGYELVSVSPVDQFPLSPHLEVVAVFRR